MTDIKTTDELKQALKTTDAVWITPRLGVVDIELQITKKEAHVLMVHLGDSSPEELEIFGETLGWIDGNNDLHIG